MPRAFGKYELLKEIASGGMAAIYIAKQREEDGREKIVVIKMIRSNLQRNREFIHMFLNEARIASRLFHPNVVRMYDLGYSEGKYYIAMEYIHGSNLLTLHKVCHKLAQKMSLPHILNMICQACEGLHYTHTKTDVMGHPLHIVHRDISPQNIMVAFSGLVKIVDFGVARAASRAGEIVKDVITGKLDYMSPEQAMGKNLDARTDIFALGIVFWEMVSGRALFGHHPTTQILREIVEGTIAPPTQINEDVPPEIEAIILKALAKRPEDRFKSAWEMREALIEAAAHKGMISSIAELSQTVQDLFVNRMDWVRKVEIAQKKGAVVSALFSDLKVEPFSGYLPEMNDWPTEEMPVLKLEADSPVAWPIEQRPSIPRAWKKWVWISLGTATVATIALFGWWFFGR